MHTDLPELERDFSREGRENDITIYEDNLLNGAPSPLIFTSIGDSIS